MNIKKVYYTLQEIYGVICETPDTLPYCIKSIDKVAEDLFGGSQPTYPITITDANIKKLWLEIYARYYKEAVICRNFGICENVPDLDNATYLLSIGDEFQEWFLKMISIISRTYNYFNTLLSAYADAQTHLMDDIKASSKNTIKFNETPQNANTSGVYEGDDHITTFTKTEGENASPLTSKIMRLKEIQDHYKKTMDDWVKEFQCLFYEL